MHNEWILLDKKFQQLIELIGLVVLESFLLLHLLKELDLLFESVFTQVLIKNACLVSAEVNEILRLCFHVANICINLFLELVHSSLQCFLQ